MEGEQSASEVLNLFVCEVMNNEIDLPIHIVECLKDVSGEEDVKSKKQLKNALSNANISDIFKEEKFVLQGSKQIFLDTQNITKEQRYSIFTKDKNDDCNFLNFFSSNFNDVSLTNTYEEIKILTTALSGVYNRTELLRESDEMSLDNQIDVLSTDLNSLGKYIHWQICKEYNLRGRTELSNLPLMITGAVLVKAYILTDIMQCNSTCGKVYSGLDETSVKECECGGEILLAPPMLRVDTVSFVVPEDIENKVSFQEEVSPKNIFNLINKAFLNRKLLLILNQLTEYKINEKIAIPSDAVFRYKDTNDVIRVQYIHEVKDEKEIHIFACITDSRFSDPEFISCLFLPGIMRDIKSGLKGDFNWEQVISRSELRDWKVTPFIKGKELEKTSSFKEMYSLFAGGVNDE